MGAVIRDSPPKPSLPPSLIHVVQRPCYVGTGGAPRTSLQVPLCVLLQSLLEASQVQDEVGDPRCGPPLALSLWVKHCPPQTGFLFHCRRHVLVPSFPSKPSPLCSFSLGLPPSHILNQPLSPQVRAQTPPQKARALSFGQMFESTPRHVISGPCNWQLTCCCQSTGCGPAESVVTMMSPAKGSCLGLCEKGP